jgi:hypothetical protein
MSTTHQGKSGGKPRQRSRKTHQPSRKPEQPQSPTPDPRNETQIGSVIASPEVSTDDTAAPVAVIAEVEQAGAPLIGAVFPANKDPVSIQTIANAYRDYTRRSLQESEVLGRSTRQSRFRTNLQGKPIQRLLRRRKGFVNSTANLPRRHSNLGRLCDQGEPSRAPPADNPGPLLMQAARRQINSPIEARP